MRAEAEIEEYTRVARARFIYECTKCKGKDPSCKCHYLYETAVAAYEACVPMDFWNIKPKDVKHNVEVFRGLVVKYVKNFRKAFTRGYGVVLCGPNGAGKSYFISYILMQAIRVGRTAYYTTLPDLYYYIKKGFDDKKIEQRLDWMLTSDIVAIDEMGKEQRVRDQDSSYINGEIERILKRRYDDTQPTLLGTNMGYSQLTKFYGETIASMLHGKYKAAQLQPGDYRKQMALRMDKDMGY